MLTTEQLAAIKQRSAEGYIKRVSAIVSYQLFGKAKADIVDLITEVERLQAEVERLSVFESVVFNLPILDLEED